MANTVVLPYPAGTLIFETLHSDSLSWRLSVDDYLFLSTSVTLT